MLSVAVDADAHLGQVSFHYYLACETGSPAYYSIGHIAKFGTLDGAYGQVTVQHLWPCGTANNSGQQGWALVNVANLQGGTHDVAQIGYGICRPPTGASCQNGFPNYAHDFWYTKQADGGIFPATWYDANGDGVHDRPQIGDEYAMWVDSTVGAGGQLYWRYYIQDITAGTPYQGHSELRHDTSEGEAWWGYEVINDAGVNGDKAIDPLFNMHTMRTRTSGVWGSVLNGSQVVNWAPVAQPSWVSSLSTGSPADSFFDLWTNSHQ